jgi:hypothetical protein
VPADALDRTLLPVFLGDHLALATGAAELARRAVGTPTREHLDGQLASLATDLAADRLAVLRLHEVLGIPQDRLKDRAAWLGEKLGRLKLNGRLTSSSPLSAVTELQGLAALCGTLAGFWAGVQAAAGDDPRVAALDPAGRAAAMRERRDALTARVDGAVRAALVR